MASKQKQKPRVTFSQEQVDFLETALNARLDQEIALERKEAKLSAKNLDFNEALRHDTVASALLNDAQWCVNDVLNALERTAVVGGE